MHHCSGWLYALPVLGILMTVIGTASSNADVILNHFHGGINVLVGIVMMNVGIAACTETKEISPTVVTKS
jgi:hypothetical protein